MAALGDLVVNLTANTRNFVSGITRSRSVLGKFASGAGKIIKAGVVGALGAATVGVYKLTQQLSSLDEVAKLAARTGFNPATISAFGFAAEQSGSDIQTANKALDRFTRTLGDAASGSGESADAISALGLNVNQLLSMSPEKQLLQVSQAISLLPTKAQQANAAFELFGRSGQQLVNVLATGESGIRSFMDEADGLGLGFSADELAKVEQANDAMNRLKRAAGAFASTITVRVAPALESMFTGINNASASMGGFGEASDSVLSFVGDTWKWLQDSIAYGITAAMAIAEWAITNWQDIGVMSFKTVALNAVQLFSVIGHFFTTTIPGYLTWFGDNWQSIFFTAFDFVATGFINLGKNIRNVWSAILDYITGSSDTLQFTWTPLLEGFRNSVSELPDIPERAISELEKTLSEDVDAIGARLGTSFDSIVTERLKTLEDMQSEASKLTKPDAPKLKPPTIANIDEFGVGTDDAAKKRTEVKSAGVMQKGSAEAFATVVRSMQSSPQVKEQQKSNKLLGMIAKNTKGKPGKETALKVKLQEAV